MDLRKEYNRYCKLYSSEPLEIVASPLEKASFAPDSVELDLKGRGLRGVDCMALGKILASNTSISHLNMSDCLLLPQGFGSLLDGIGRNGTLQILELRGNNIQGKMVDNLSTFLKQNTTLKTLLLEWNCLGASHPTFQTFCESLSHNRGLHHLDLRNNLIADECGNFLASALRSNTNLQSLDLRWNSLGIQGAKELWDAVQCTPDGKLESIELTGNFVPEEIVRHLQTSLSSKVKSKNDPPSDDDNTTHIGDGDYDSNIHKDNNAESSTKAQQLQRTEDTCACEIKKMLTVFDDEELLHQEALRGSQAQISALRKELANEKQSKEEVLQELGKLRGDLESSLEIEKSLRESLQAMNEFILQKDAAVKIQAAEIEARFEGQITKVTKELECIQGENEELSKDLKKALASLDGIRNLIENR